MPASAKGKRVFLYAPAVETEAWVWVNGKYIGHREYHEAYERPNAIDMDVTGALEPGKRNVSRHPRAHRHELGADQRGDDFAAVPVCAEGREEVARCYE